MLNYINAKELFNDAENSYEVIRRVKRATSKGIEYIYIRNRNRMTPKRFMFIVVDMCQKGYSLQETYNYLYNMI